MKHRFSVLIWLLSAAILTGCQDLYRPKAESLLQVSPSVAKVGQALRAAPPRSLADHQRDVLWMHLQMALTAATGLTGDIRNAPELVSQQQLLLHAPASTEAPLQPASSWALERIGEEQIRITEPGAVGGEERRTCAEYELVEDSFAAYAGAQFFALPAGLPAGVSSATPWTSEAAHAWNLQHAVTTVVGVYARAYDQFPVSWEAALTGLAIAPVGYQWLPAPGIQLPEPAPAGVHIVVHPGRHLVRIFRDQDPRPMITKHVTWEVPDTLKLKAASVPAELPASEWVWWGTMRFPD